MISSDSSREELLKLERDIQIARQIQASFLPDQLPQPEGWDIGASFEPAREVAGDFYDVFMLTQNRRVGIVVADVCGKGVGAALFMSLTRSLIRAFAQQHYTISSWTDVLSDDAPRRSQRSSGSRRKPSMPVIGASALKNAVVLTNNYITTNHRDLNYFVTLFFGVLDPVTGGLIYMNNGHEPPVILGSSGVKSHLETTGPAVGLMPDMNFSIGEAHLEPGDMLFCYTDGVTDARSPERAFFGEQQLHQLLEQQPWPSVRGMLQRVETALHAHIASADQFDDITMLAAQRLVEEHQQEQASEQPAGAE